MSSESGRTLAIHSVLYLNEPIRVLQSIAHLDRAVDHAMASGHYSRAVLRYGDCSPRAVFSPDELDGIKESLYAIGSCEHVFFDANLGSALGHNTLLEASEEDDVLILNPDVMPSPRALVELSGALRDDRVGMAEAKQLPIEHPKHYDPITGETSWAATACSLIKGETIRNLQGFDHQSFFLYCDDVDFSWRVRLAGEKVVYVPTASAYHDKRLGSGGAWLAGAAERFYSAQAALFLSYKYSRADLTNRWLVEFEATGEENYLKAAASFRQRERDGTLPVQIDPEGKVAMFVDGNYAPHRFSL